MEKNISSIEQENLSLKKELEGLKLHLSELEATANHLVSATWRERDMKKKLADTIEELNVTKSLLEAQNKRVAESINYARKIQLAINTTERDLLQQFKSGFIYYNPKDVISGDFPWMFVSPSHMFVAAVDCTGHGVPGAMLSMIGNLLLNEIVTLMPAGTPAEVIAELHTQIVFTLKQGQSANNSNDGMDIAMCSIDIPGKKLVFSGAHRPLIISRGDDLIYTQGDRYPVGGIQYKGKNTYTDQVFSLETGDRVFLFSDGIVDQIGGPEKKKWMINGLKEFINQTRTLPMPQVREELEKAFYSHKRDQKQIDDVLVIAIEI